MHEEIGDVKTEVKGIRLELKKNGKCLTKIDKTMAVYKLRVKTHSILLIFLFILILIGFATGLEFFGKGILGFIK